MRVQIDVDHLVTFLVGLLNTPSPTGYTAEAISYTQDAFAPYLSMKTTPKGVLVGTLAGERDDALRAITAHTDTLGAMVQEIRENGRLRVEQTFNIERQAAKLARLYHSLLT